MILFVNNNRGILFLARSAFAEILRLESYLTQLLEFDSIINLEEDDE